MCTSHALVYLHNHGLARAFQVVDLVPKYIQLLLVEEPKTRITAAIGALTDRQVLALMLTSRMAIHALLVPNYRDLFLHTCVDTQRFDAICLLPSLTMPKVAELMAPAPEVTARRAETLAALEKLREAEKMIFDVARMENTSTIMSAPY